MKKTDKHLQIKQIFNIKNLIHFLLFFGCSWAAITLFRYFQEIIFVFIIASILAFCLNYPVRYLERYLGRGLARGIVIFIALVIVVGMLVGFIFYALSQLQELSNSLVENFQNLSLFPSSWQKVEAFLERQNLNINLRPFLEILAGQFQSGVSSLFNILTMLPSTFLGVIFILVISFFMLTDGQKLWHLVLEIIPNEYRPRVEKAIKQSFIGFFRGQLLLCLSLSIFSFLAFWLLEISHAGALAIIVAVLDTIPGIGATLGVITISLITLVQGSWIEVLKVIGVSILLQQIQDNYIAPKIMQNTVNLNPVVVFFSIMVGAKIAGLLGIFLSVPIAGTIVNLFQVEEMQSEN